MYIATVRYVLLDGSIKKLSKAFASERECNAWLNAKKAQIKRYKSQLISVSYTCA